MKEKFYLTVENITNNKIEEIGITNIDLVLYLKRPKIYRDYNFSNVKFIYGIWLKIM